MNLYAESSAVLAWLLGESPGDAIVDLLEGADFIVSSELTLVECDRALIRARSEKLLTEAAQLDRRATLNGAAAGWQLLTLSTSIIDRAREPFPGDPIRTLDALHVASLLVARSAVPGVALLSLDKRIRTVARELGFAIVPNAS